jgi:hypothetical protein
MGVIVFRADGAFGYQFAAKHELYSEDRLPPHRGRYRVAPSGRLTLFGLGAKEPRFRIEIRDGGERLWLTRLEPNGSLPRTALYERQEEE